MPGETAIHDLHVRPNIDGRPIYPQIFIESTAALGGIFLDGVNVRDLHKLAYSEELEDYAAECIRYAHEHGWGHKNYRVARYAIEGAFAFLRGRAEQYTAHLEHMYHRYNEYDADGPIYGPPNLLCDECKKEPE